MPIIHRLGLRALAARPAMRPVRHAPALRSFASRHGDPARGQEPPLPTEATPQDATVPPMYPNTHTLRGEQPPLPTDEDGPVPTPASASASAPARPAPATTTARHGDPVPGQEPPLPTEATPQDATVPPMYPNTHTPRGEQPPLPTDEDASTPPLAAAAGGAPRRVAPHAGATGAHDATWGQESPLPTPASGAPAAYPATPPQPPRGQEPPLPGEAVPPPFTAPAVAPVRQDPPPPPKVEPVYQPPPPPPKKRTFTKLFLTFVLGSVLGAAYVPWYRSVQQDTRALEAILVERERAGEKYIEGRNEHGQYILKPGPATSQRAV